VKSSVPEGRSGITNHREWPLLSQTLISVPAPCCWARPLHADNDVNTLSPNNHRLNDGVVANVFTVQHQAGCTNDVKINPQLQLAAQWQTHDVLNNRDLDGDVGSDGSTPQARANAAGYRGQVAETVAINPALAISGIELINQWYYNPAYNAIMSNCANTQIGCGRRTVWIAPSWWPSTGSQTNRSHPDRLDRK
jgi:uncharacterized protein YkwD